MYYIITNGDFCLSKDWCEAGAKLLGYGGVWVKDKRKAQRFYPKAQALKELKTMQQFGGGRYATIEKVGK